MTKREIASLSFRLMGIYCLVEMIFLLSRVAGIWPLIESGSYPLGAKTSGTLKIISHVALELAVPLALLGVLTWALIWRGQELAGWIFPEGAPPAGPSATTREVQAVAFSVLGLYLLATSVGPLTSFLALLMSEERKQLQLGWYALRNSDQILQFLLGLFLFLRPRIFASAWHALRHYGHPDPAPPPPPQGPEPA